MWFIQLVPNKFCILETNRLKYILDDFVNTPIRHAVPEQLRSNNKTFLLPCAHPAYQQSFDELEEKTSNQSDYMRIRISRGKLADLI